MSKKHNNPKRKEKTPTIVDALSTVAHVTTEKPAYKKRKSKFFFKLAPEPVQEKIEVPVNEEVVKRTDKIKTTLPKDLINHSIEVREFFLQELAPLTLAGIMGAEQARSVLSEALGVEVDVTTEVKFRGVLAKAVDLRILRFVGKYMQLDDTELEQFMDIVKPKKPANIILPLGDSNANSTQKSRKSKASRAK